MYSAELVAGSMGGEVLEHQNINPGSILNTLKTNRYLCIYIYMCIYCIVLYKMFKYIYIYNPRLSVKPTQSEDKTFNQMSSSGSDGDCH